MNLKLTIFSLLILFSIGYIMLIHLVNLEPSFQTFAAITPKQTRSAKLAHEAITTDLYHGRVVEGRLFSETNGHNAIYIVKVFNPKTGRYREVYSNQEDMVMVEDGIEYPWSTSPMSLA